MKFLSKLFGRGSDEIEPTVDSEPPRPEPQPEPQTDAAMESVEPVVESAPVEPIAEPVLIEPVVEPALLESVVESPPVESDAEPVLVEPDGELIIPVEPVVEPASLDLTVALASDPRCEELHQAVAEAFPEVEERLGFYEKLESENPAEPYHSVSLGRAYRQSGQLREAVGFYQKYLCSQTDVRILEELSDLFEELGEMYLANSSRMVVNSLKNKG